MSPQDNESPPPANDSQFWQVVATLTDRLVEAWRDAPEVPPRLDELLDEVEPDARRAILWELIKVDLEIRWREKNIATTLEQYVDMYPLLECIDQLPAELVFEEYQIRKSCGNPTTLDDSSLRFPLQRKGVESLEEIAKRTATFLPKGKTNLLFSRHINRRPETFSEGDTVDDFELLVLLGAGSFARVFLARQRSLSRMVALKISADEGQEPRTLARLDHPNIVRVYDQRTISSDRVRLLYMELVPGGALDGVVAALRKTEFDDKRFFNWVDDNLTRVGAAPPVSSEWRSRLRSAEWSDVVCHIGIALAEGLAHAHSQGVLHRDIKPANVLLTAEGMPKLADFNISFNSADSNERPGDAFGGSLAYMSPEQLRACHTSLGGSVHDVREASDIYSLGLLLIELLSGRRVFSKPKHDTDWEASLQQMLADRETLDRTTTGSLFSRECPESVRTVLSRCIEQDPRSRPREAQYLADQLKVCLNPRLWKLLSSPPSAIARAISKIPLLFLFLATLAPMAPIAAFNFIYNRQALVNHFPDYVSQFDHVQWWINLIGFLSGIVIGLYLGMRAVYRGGNVDRSASDHLVYLGRDLAVVTMCFWFLSGLIFPLLLHFSVPGSAEVLVFTLFMLTLTLCGLIAGIYPYLIVTFLCIRFILPFRINHGWRYPSLPTLAASRQLLRVFVALTAIVPMLATLLAVMFRDQQQITLIVLSIAGIIGFCGALATGHAIDGDLAALQEHGQSQR